MKSKVLVFFVCALCVTSGVAIAQTTTGRIMGTIIDDGGLALPGAAVSISSDVLIGGTQTKIADTVGGFVFISLQPGEYVVKASLSGFVGQELHEVRVPLAARPISPSS
jgi:hypothetical protein